MVESPRLFVWLILPVSIGTLGSLYIYGPYSPYQASLSSPKIKTYCYSHVYTLDERYPTAKCFTVNESDGKINVVTNETLRALDDKSQDTIAIPGLWDGHGHVTQLGEALQAVNLRGSRSVEDVEARILSHLKGHSNLGTRSNWVRGLGWDQSLLFPPTPSHPSRFPTSSDLSHPALRGKFILLNRIDFHCVWVSQAVVSLLPPEYQKPSPSVIIPGGDIPSEGVFCDNAIDIVMKYYPKPTKEAKTKFIERAMRELNKVGFTGITDAGVIEEELEIYTWLNDMNLLTVRINAMAECNKRNTFCPEEVNRFKGRSSDSMLSVLGVKLFADGALGSWGAALIEPYSDKPDNSGTMLINSTELQSVVTKWHTSKWQVCIHAIGDRANREAILALGKLLRHDCIKLKEKCNIRADGGPRHRIEHAQIIHPTDVQTLNSLGLIPSIQPTHATSDASYALARLGVERLKASAYKMKTLYEMSIPVVLGSDFPVEPISPWNGIYAATTRKDPNVEEENEAAFFPEEKLNMLQALRGFTIHPVYGAHFENLAGTISERKFADWVVVRYPHEREEWEQEWEQGNEEKEAGRERSAMFLEEGWNGDVRKLEVVETWVGGKKVFDARHKAEKKVRKEDEGWWRLFERWKNGWEPWGGNEVMEWVQGVFGWWPGAS